jgi:hypothetical protein
VEKIDWAMVVRKMLVWQWIIIAVGATAGAALWFISAKHMPPQIPLFYSLPWGEEQLAGSVFLAIPMGLAIIVAGIISLSIRFFKPDNVLSSILLGTGIIAEAILILAVLRTIMLVS